MLLRVEWHLQIVSMFYSKLWYFYDSKIYIHGTLLILILNNCRVNITCLKAIGITHLKSLSIPISTSVFKILLKTILYKITGKHHQFFKRKNTMYACNNTSLRKNSVLLCPFHWIICLCLTMF